MTSALIAFLLIFLVFDNEKVRNFKKKKCLKRVAEITEYFLAIWFHPLRREHMRDMDVTHI